MYAHLISEVLSTWQVSMCVFLFIIILYLIDLKLLIFLSSFTATNYRQSAAEGQLETVKFLLEKGADINATDR
jgi:hypothetical protein